MELWNGSPNSQMRSFSKTTPYEFGTHQFDIEAMVYAYDAMSLKARINLPEIQRVQVR